MERKAAKELVHIQGWLDRVDEIVERGKHAYLADDLLQEAGDSAGCAGRGHDGPQPHINL